MSKRTAGPWKYTQSAEGPQVQQDGPALARIIVAIKRFSSEDDANARLISKAPDLLALLKRYVANAHEDGLYQDAEKLLKELGEDDE